MVGLVRGIAGGLQAYSKAMLTGVSRLPVFQFIGILVGTEVFHPSPYFDCDAEWWRGQSVYELRPEQVLGQEGGPSLLPRSPARVGAKRCGVALHPFRRVGQGGSVLE